MFLKNEHEIAHIFIIVDISFVAEIVCGVCVCDLMLWLCSTTSMWVRIIWKIGSAFDISTCNDTETMQKLWWWRVRISAHTQTNTGVKSVKHINLTIGEPHTHAHTNTQYHTKICRTLKTDAKFDRQRDMKKKRERERERRIARIRLHNQSHNYTHSASSTIKAAKLT